MKQSRIYKYGALCLLIAVMAGTLTACCSSTSKDTKPYSGYLTLPEEDTNA